MDSCFWCPTLERARASIWRGGCECKRSDWRIRRRVQRFFIRHVAHFIFSFLFDAAQSLRYKFIRL
jgi:hypothetical protein